MLYIIKYCEIPGIAALEQRCIVEFGQTAISHDPQLTTLAANRVLI